MTTFSLSATLLLLGGSISSGGVAQGVDTQAAPPVQLKDNSVETSAKTKLNSVWIWSCDFGVISVGDDFLTQQGIETDRIGTLQKLVHAQAGNLLSGRTIEVSRYAISINGNAKMKGDSWNAALGGGVISKVVADGKSRKSKCGEDKMKSGWFGPGDLTSPYSPLVIEIAATIDGRPVSARGVYSPRRELINGTELKRFEPEDVEWMRQALASANQKFAEVAIAQSRP